ncbi:MAG: colicin E3/pyocin S6 family cytotoxin [Roseobacter sp.]
MENSWKAFFVVLLTIIGLSSSAFARDGKADVYDDSYVSSWKENLPVPEGQAEDVAYQAAIAAAGIKLSVEACKRSSRCKREVAKFFATSVTTNQSYKPPPKNLPAFPDAKRAKPIGGRARWVDSKGGIYEWDSQHGTAEVYDKTGKKHKGEYNSETGDKTKDGDPTRSTEN